MVPSSRSRLDQALSQGGGHRFPRAAGENKPQSTNTYQVSLLVFVNIPSNKASHMARVILGRTPNFYNLPTVSFLLFEAEGVPSETD